MNWQPGKQPIMGGHRIAERLADLERQVAELKKAIQVSPAEVVIKSQGGVKIEANGIVKIEASLLTLPGGGRPIVRVGDLVTGGPGTGTISGPGNALVLG